MLVVGAAIGAASVRTWLHFLRYSSDFPWWLYWEAYVLNYMNPKYRFIPDNRFRCLFGADSSLWYQNYICAHVWHVKIIFTISLFVSQWIVWDASEWQEMKKKCRRNGTVCSVFSFFLRHSHALRVLSNERKQKCQAIWSWKFKQILLTRSCGGAIILNGCRC